MLPNPLHEELQRLYRRAGVDVPLPGDPYWAESSRLREEVKQVRQEIVRVALEYQGKEYRYDPPNYSLVVQKKEIEKKAEKMPPEGVNIIAGGAKRIGEPARTATIEHLQEAFANGEIPEEELDARVKAAMKSVVKEDLDLLVRDLEPARERVVKNTGVPEIIKPAPAFTRNAGLAAAISWSCCSLLVALSGSTVSVGGQAMIIVGSLSLLACVLFVIRVLFGKF